MFASPRMTIPEEEAAASIALTYVSGSGQTGAGGDTPAVSSGVSVGDIIVFIGDESGTSSTTPVGGSSNNFTQLSADVVHDNSARTLSFWYKIAESGDISANITWGAGTKRFGLAAYSPDVSIGTVTIDIQNTEETNGTPTQQSIDATGAVGDDVMFGFQWGSNSCTGFSMSSTDVSGTPGAVSDHIGVAFYNSGGGSGVTVDGNDEGVRNYMTSGIIDVQAA